MAVEFVAAGAFTGSTEGLTVTWPGTESAGDVALLLVESGYSDTVSVSGWTEVDGSPKSSSPNNHKLNVFYKVVGSSESSVSISDPGNHGAAQILVFSGVDNTTPINVSTGTIGTSSASITVPEVTTTVDDCAIVHIAGTGHDSSTTADFSGWTNSNLASITEISDNVIGVGGGGGFGVAWGILESAGSSGTCAVTQASSIIWSGITVALAPASSGAITGTLSGTLGDATTASAGALAIAGAASVTLAAATLSASGSLAVSGSGALTITLDDANLVGTGKLAIAGAVSKTLDAATVSSAGELVVPGGGSLSATLADATVSATSTLRIGATAAGLLADATASATAQISISGALAQTLAAATLVSAGSVPGAAPSITRADIIAAARTLRIAAAARITHIEARL